MQSKGAPFPISISFSLLNWGWFGSNLIPLFHFFLKIYSIVVVYSYIKDLCRDPIPPGNNGQQEPPRAISTAKFPSKTHHPSRTSSGFSSSSDRRKPKSSGNYISIVSMLRKLLNQILPNFIAQKFALIPPANGPAFHLWEIVVALLQLQCFDTYSSLKKCIKIFPTT